MNFTSVTYNTPAPTDLVSPAALCSVLVPSCDAYSDLWKPFFALFWQYWPDCPFPVYLGSNLLTFADTRVITVHAGHGSNWSNRVREQLLALNTPYILLMLEDFFLRDPVLTKDVLARFADFRKLNAKMLRIVPNPKPDQPMAGYPSMGRIERGAPYRLSTQVAFWQREALLDLMRKDESIWQFEIYGSRRSDSDGDGFYSVWHTLMPYGHVVERGKWFRSEAWHFGKLNIGCDFSARPVMTAKEMLKWRLSFFKGFLSRKIPWPIRSQLVRLVGTLRDKI